MAELIQEIFPGKGGLNWDDDYRFMDGNDSDYRLNVVNNGFGNEFVVTNMLGTTSYSHAFTHAAAYAASVYQCVGDCYDDNRNSIYFFLYGSAGNDSILRFNFSDKSFNKIVWDHTAIGLDPDYPITDAFMIGNWLHFNPRTSSPRSINVQWAHYDFVSYGFNPFGGGTRVVGNYVRWLQRVYICTQNIADDEYPNENPDYYRFVDYCYDDVFPVNAASIIPDPQTPGLYRRYRNFYNIPTILPNIPVATVATDTDYEYNNIRGRRFQFCYRQYVPDQGYTITSPFTGIIASPVSETNKGEIAGDIQQYNNINITFPIASLSAGMAAWWDWDFLFEFVELLVREGPEDNWKVAERINHDSVFITSDANYNAYCSIDFYNDKAYEVVDNVAVEKQYNPLPKLANAQWSLDGQRSAYGGITEGFNPIVDLEVSLTTGERKIDIAKEPGAVAVTYTWTTPVYDADRDDWYWESSVNVALASADLNDIIKVIINGVPWYRVLSAADIVSTATYAAAMIGLLAQGGVTAFAVAGPKVGFYLSSPSPGAVDAIQLFGAATTDTIARKFSSFKNGAWHPFCLYYYDDALRRSEPVFDETMRVYMETLPEVLGNNVSNNYQRYIDWTITHLPPQWARWWSWGYAGNQTIDVFWQYNIQELSVEAKGTSADFWTRIDISGLQQLAADDSGFDHYFPNTTIEAYTFVPGDRVRFITNHTASPTDYSDLDIMNNNYDYEIKEFDDVNFYIFIDTLVVPPTTTTTTTPESTADNTYIIEIYRPKKQTGTTVYYEFGDLYQVYETGGVYYHRGDSEDQSAGVTAKGQFNSGDVWVITRLFAESPFAAVDNAVFVESYSWSDFYDTEGWGRGKAGVFTGIGEKYLNNIRYSNRYSPNTKTSGLSTFDFDDRKPMSVDHGNIIAMRQAGNTLKVYFERNSAAVLVNKSQFYNADGTSQVIKSDEILGDAVYSNYNYGTIFPESVFLKDRTVYFFDIYRDAFIRDSSNGLEAISDNKMRRYFSEKAAALLTSGISNVQVWTTYDYSYDNVVVHFKDSHTAANSAVILYHEPSNRWTSFLQVTTTTPVFGRGSMNLISFLGQNVWMHNTNATRNLLWGSQRSSIVAIIANEAGNVKKTFEAIGIHSNAAWSAPIITIPADATYVNGMHSQIPAARFVLREGAYYSDYLRNDMTHQASSSSLDLVRGEQLRGYYLDHWLQNSSTSEVILFKVEVHSNVSRV